MSEMLSDAALDQLFRQARTYNGFTDRPVGGETLRQIHDLLRWGPTSANCCPLRIVFLTTPEAKERLRPALSAGNLAKTMSAPVTAILAYDTQFADHLPRLFPHVDARPWFSHPDVAFETAFRNSTLQAGYFLLAARAVGLDCGPMSGFDQGKVNAEFFADGRFKVNFICNLGYGDPVSLFERSPRFDFEDVCQIL
ncbi:malonic semialdehyde reductase [Niveispirillum lacus]|uniref:Putative NADH dehydrogenase/NAD(P)H nitroreductase CHU95_08110 n=1 Tax=Niveispirillum lacus TaxID=1981099 RepID=A0A255Z144_9PROT|nr:malonic semialdehyde reductase [Niveispirillum lacus]OYQ35188.1 malonic semialdehyde reductase [Niveispirillum lacus]